MKCNLPAHEILPLFHEAAGAISQILQKGNENGDPGVAHLQTCLRCRHVFVAVMADTLMEALDPVQEPTEEEVYESVRHCRHIASTLIRNYELSPEDLEDGRRNFWKAFNAIRVENGLGPFHKSGDIASDNQSPEDETHAGKDEDNDYVTWLFRDSELSEARRQSFEKRYQDDEAFREETDKIRAAAGTIEESAEAISALFEPKRSAADREEVKRRFHERRAAKQSGQSDGTA